MFDTIATKALEPARWLVILGIAYTLATSVWSFFDAPAPTRIVAVDTARETSAKPLGNVNWILAKHLFGEAGAEPAVAENDGPAVQTRLPLELKSVFVADEDPSASIAIVAQRGKPGESYGIDDTLPGNAKLVEVLKDRIVLRRAGQRETLMFPEWKAQKFSQAQEPPANDAPRYSPDEADEDLENLQDGEALPDEYGDEDESAAAAIEEVREKLANDAAGALAEFGLETADSGGYRLGNVADSPYLRRTGLQAGDVILSVNGQPVGDIQQDQLQIDNILAQGTARIEIQRGERRFTITASLPQ